MLIENTLWGERDKVHIAIERLRQFEPDEGYYLAFSGGKDSVTIYRLAEMAGVAFDAHYRVTTVDPPELVKFIKAKYPTVARDRPEMTMFQLMCLPHHFMPPMRQARWCCEALKERGGEGRIVVTGIRWEESPRRKKRRMIEQCYADTSKTYLSPIIDWTEHEVWSFIHQEKLDYCSLYDEGFKRIGCILCPYEGNPHRIKKQMARWPQFVKAYVNTFDKLVVLRKTAGLKCTWANGQELFDWWIKRHPKPAPQEARLFD